MWVFGGKEVKPLGLLGEPSKNRSWKGKRGLGWQASSGLGAGTHSTGSGRWDDTSRQVTQEWPV